MRGQSRKIPARMITGKKAHTKDLRGSVANRQGKWGAGHTVRLLSICAHSQAPTSFMENGLITEKEFLWRMEQNGEERWERLNAKVQGESVMETFTVASSLSLRGPHSYYEVPQEWLLDQPGAQWDSFPFQYGDMDLCHMMCPNQCVGKTFCQCYVMDHLKMPTFKRKSPCAATQLLPSPQTPTFHLVRDIAWLRWVTNNCEPQNYPRS